MSGESAVLRFVAQAQDLPAPPTEGRIVMLDVAFAYDPGWDRCTLPFIEAIGDRLALWVDHHDHRAWPLFRDDPRYILVPKHQARACPQLIDPDVVQRAGRVDHVWAHADMDGCIAAAKFLRGGIAPYAEADEDARFADAPGQGFVCSERGRRLCLAVDQASASMRSRPYASLLVEIAQSLVSGEETSALAARLDTLADEQRSVREALAPLVDAATSPLPGVLLVQTPDDLGGAKKKYVLRVLEERAPVAIIIEDEHLTVATFHDDQLDLSDLPGLRGQKGYAWGNGVLSTVLEAIGRQLEWTGLV